MLARNPPPVSTPWHMLPRPHKPINQNASAELNRSDPATGAGPRSISPFLLRLHIYILTINDFRIRCDRNMPCRNCRRLPPGICAYPADGRKKRQPAKKRQEPDDIKDVFNHVEKLERILRDMARTRGSKVAQQAQKSTSVKAETRNGYIFKMSSSAPHGFDGRLIEDDSWEFVLSEVRPYISISIL